MSKAWNRKIRRRVADGRGLPNWLIDRSGVYIGGRKMDLPPEAVEMANSATGCFFEKYFGYKRRTIDGECTVCGDPIRVLEMDYPVCDWCAETMWG